MTREELFNCKFIYTTNTNVGITMYMGEEGKFEFGKELAYFTDYKYDDKYCFRTSKVISAQKKDRLLYIETLNSTYIFELLKDLEIPKNYVTKEFYKEHQKMMNAKSTKFLTKSLDGFIEVIELPEEMTKTEVIKYFKENKMFVDYVLAPVSN
ncbi:hypothetical protein [Halarcobacter anaerophilus]|uniref:hypothetical protein n=1 Tax=Halarcobacter anaerophilus TaxID=877500 RepID=UPI0005CA255D|nr:hypothetical protein [Halarcobacter anaerophilus]